MEISPIPRVVVGSPSTSTAPLAQLVERFHGKEEVNGSIPLGGSDKYFPRMTLGGVAQLGRANGS